MHTKLQRGVVAVTTAALLTGMLGISGADAVLPNSTFEGNDGNLVVNTPGNTDWTNAPHRNIGTDLPTGTSDNSFGQGTKEDDTAVTVGLGSIPNSKADLAQFYVGNEQVGTDTLLYLGWTRANTSGTTNFDFEVNQAPQPDLTTAGQNTLVRTAGDFGVSGELPSHPALLDWLAVTFRDSGWDVKRFFKLLVTSATYRQAARTTPEKRRLDPQNRLPRNIGVLG